MSRKTSTDLLRAPAGRGASPEGERGGLPAASRSSFRKRSGIVLPTSSNDAITPYLPGDAGRAIISITHDAHSLAHWTGFALFCGDAALTLVVAAILLVRRDTLGGPRSSATRVSSERSRAG